MDLRAGRAPAWAVYGTAASLSMLAENEMAAGARLARALRARPKGSACGGPVALLRSRTRSSNGSPRRSSAGAKAGGRSAAARRWRSPERVRGELNGCPLAGGSANKVEVPPLSGHWPPHALAPRPLASRVNPPRIGPPAWDCAKVGRLSVGCSAFELRAEKWRTEREARRRRSPERRRGESDGCPQCGQTGEQSGGRRGIRTHSH
jgi:hypothetical protein